jgi:hypothetical protein
MTAFALLIWSTFMSIILEIGLHLRAPTSPQDSVFFHEWYRIGYLAQLIIWGIAVILLIRYVQKSFEEKPPPNLSPHPSAVDAPNSATRPTPAVGGGSSPGR